MKDLKLECKLNQFDIMVQNEGSPDEPYLWVFYLKIDGQNINEFNADQSFVTIHNPSGSHGNLGPDSDDETVEEAPLNIPAAIGKWETSIDTMGTMLPITAPFCAVAILVIAIEEDAAPSTATAEEARKELKKTLQAELNKELRKIIRERKIDFGNLEGNLDLDKLKDAIKEVMSGEIIRNVLLGIFLNPLFFIGSDVDDFIGYKVAGPYMMKDFLHSMTDKIPFDLVLDQSGNNFDGRYKVSGHIKVTSPVQYSQPAAVQHGNDLTVIGRAMNVDKFYRAKSDNNGGDWSGFKKIGDGTFKSSPAAVMSESGSDLHVFGRGLDDKYWRAKSTDGGKNWVVAWSPVLEGVFTSPPAAAISGDGKSVYLFGKGNDNRCWFATSKNGGDSWQGFSPIGAGVFMSGFSAACSADGKIVHVYGLGMDRRIWWARSVDGCKTWVMAWKAIPNGSFHSAPAVVCKPDGKHWAVFARGMNKRMNVSFSFNQGESWSLWRELDMGTFISSPAASIASDGKRITLYGIGENCHLYFIKSADFGLNWGSKYTRINKTESWA